MSGDRLTRWTAVARYEGLYEVSDDGQIRSLPRAGMYRIYGGRVLKQTMGSAGYPTVGLYRDGKMRPYTVHSLVAEAFHGPRPEGHEVRHLDGDKLNNRASNLAYGTSGDNKLDSVRHGTHRQARKTHCLNGHPLSGDNLYVNPRGQRQCRACRRNRRAA